MWLVWRRFRVKDLPPYAGPGPILESRIVLPTAETVEKWVLYKVLESTLKKTD
jgi:hypothetical protein